MMTIEKRMDNLERQNRHLRLGLLGLMALVVGALLVGATKGVPDRIEVKQLSIIDDDGKIAISLGTSSIGPFFSINGSGGTIEMGSFVDLTYINMTDTKEQTHVNFEANGNGSYFTLSDESTGNSCRIKSSGKMSLYGRDKNHLLLQGQVPPLLFRDGPRDNNIHEAIFK